MSSAPDSSFSTDAARILQHLAVTIPDQTGLLLAATSDGAMLASSGLLHNDRNVLKQVISILRDARALVAFSSERDRLKRLTLTAGDHLLAITADDKLIYIVNRTITA
ncbi:hypothetical protein SeLEV6574_g01351 [Synchytrium endobioticum]|nr:hypothetical protein SeLEV6574_g01351 [Synchytrium endobioticum]